MNEARIPSGWNQRGELRLFSVVSLWVVLASFFLAPASLQGCESHAPGLRPVAWAASVGVTGTAVSADRTPGDSQPVPSDEDQGDGCCCPAPCSGCATGFTTGSFAVEPHDPVAHDPGSRFSTEAGPAASDDPFFLPFAIPPPLSA